MVNSRTSRTIHRRPKHHFTLSYPHSSLSLTLFLALLRLFLRHAISRNDNARRICRHHVFLQIPKFMPFWQEDQLNYGIMRMEWSHFQH